MSLSGERDWRSWPCDSGIARPAGVSVPAQDAWHAAHGMGHPRPCSLTAAQVRDTRTAGDAAQAGWARHRRACKAGFRAARRAASIRQCGTLKGGRLGVGAHTPRARVHAARMRETSATRTPLIARVENSRLFAKFEVRVRVRYKGLSAGY